MKKVFVLNVEFRVVKMNTGSTTVCTSTFGRREETGIDFDLVFEPVADPPGPHITNEVGDLFCLSALTAGMRYRGTPN